MPCSTFTNIGTTPPPNWIGPFKLIAELPPAQQSAFNRDCGDILHFIHLYQVRRCISPTEFINLISDQLSNTPNWGISNALHKNNLPVLSDATGMMIATRQRHQFLRASRNRIYNPDSIICYKGYPPDQTPI
ncbi:MAG: hypothetical protein R2857_01450 [Vampirovibrionales bacterium]